jgi:hypothetical protein
MTHLWFATPVRLFVARILLLVTLGSITALTSGCAGTVIVEYSLDAQVSRTAQNGVSQHATKENFFTPALPLGTQVAFPALHYKGNAFEWAISASAFGLGGTVSNFAATPLCFRLDQAMLSSNFHSSETPLRVATVFHMIYGTPNRTGSNRPTDRKLFVPQPLCFLSEKPTSFSFWPELSELFPSDKMFNVRWPEGEPQLTERGVGNWIKLRLPIEYDGKLETLEVTLTVNDSRARVAHY